MNQREQFFRSLAFATVIGFKNQGDVTHMDLANLPGQACFRH